MLIAHATDLSGDDDAAFLHAAAIASASDSPVISLYAGLATDAARPDAAVLARRWQRSIDHTFRCVQCCDEVADTVIDALATLQPSLVVLGTHARHGLSAFLHGSVSEAIARNVRVPVLIVPNGRVGFVDRETGGIQLERVLIPAGTAAEAELGIAAARRLAAQTGVSPTIHLVHVGPIDAAFEGFGVVRITGTIENAIVTAAHRIAASAIVMPTHGHDGIGDVVSGTHTEHVVRDVGLPVLVVPS
jgi:nucleotide-binding universal stress UspA family protein